MRVNTSGYKANDPGIVLLPSLLAVQGITSAPGNAFGTTLVDANLANEPSYADGISSVKMLSGPSAGQVRNIAIHAGNTLTVAAPFTNAAGAVQQVGATLAYVILSVGGGGGGAPVLAPSIGLWMFGECDPAMVASATAIVCPNLAGFPDNIFNNEFWMQVIHNFDAPGTAPEREWRRITNYVGATGAFTTDAFTANVEANDLVAIVHESIMALEILGFGTLDTSSATVPADSTRTEGDNYFNGSLLMTTEGAVRFQPRRIVDYTGVGGIFAIDPNNTFTAATGLVDYIIIAGQTEFVPAADGANNRTTADVVGNRTSTIPAMNLAPGDWDIVRHLKAILERVGATPGDPDDSLHIIHGQRDDAAIAMDTASAGTDSVIELLRAILERIGETPADPDDSVLTNVGQRDDAATADDLSDVATTSIQAKLRRLLLRFSVDAFSATVNPGAAAATDVETMIQDLADMLAGATGIVTFPASAVPGDGVSMAEVLRQIYDDLAAINAGFQEQADTAVNITAILAAETDVFDLNVAATRYIIRSLRLKCADPGANIVTVRLYELVNDVSTVVDTFSITTANFGTHFSLMDMFGLSHLAGDDLQVTVQASAGGPYTVTGQYSHATAT